MTALIPELIAMASDPTIKTADLGQRPKWRPKGHCRAALAGWRVRKGEPMPLLTAQLHAFRLDGLEPFDAALIALCDDGSIWEKAGIHNQAEWVKIDSIPQYD
ncbi:hypothetical protein KAM448_40490 [Aeromonas caviae]|uniref:Uncharacterized protein n=1 Tax=Aeromonas caviae TaxID=648 RepID=A0ABD0B8W0_AERCA|nr:MULTISPECIES: hypothetical protein [Aeromonas]BCK65851.1 hypothetical protein KAM330_48400 [Aeromonas hydrophila]BCR31442.1 hypothetical protein KAM376_44480 [Aeromonas caviae]GJA71894.1 hypothetical protein KAM353_15410 [Aeromonas caviae]GJA81637.1 hypothetical protein KAM355_21970 [Aeromonas caviae]GJB00129.1 hypothetical protein KAM359_35360 [Aeromonas caviae]